MPYSQQHHEVDMSIYALTLMSVWVCHSYHNRERALLFVRLNHALATVSSTSNSVYALTFMHL